MSLHVFIMSMLQNPEQWIWEKYPSLFRLMIVTVVMSVGLFIPLWYGRYKTGSWTWLLKVHNRYRGLAWQGSTVLASLIVCISIWTAWVFLHPSGPYSDSLISSTGYLYSVVTAIFMFWSFYNTMILRVSQEARVADIPQLLHEATRAINEVVSGLQDEKEKKEISYFYMLDYAPGLGIRYATTADERFRLALHNLFHEPGIKDARIEAVFYPDDQVEAFHRNLGATATEIDTVLYAIRDMDEITGCNGAVWRTRDIGSLHCIVMNHLVLQYVVIPETNGARSKAIGIKSEDVFLISFFKEMIEGTIRACITPSACEFNGADYVLKLQEQQHIKKVQIFLSKDNNFSVSPDINVAQQQAKQLHPLEKDWPTTNPLQISLSPAEVGDNKYLKIILIKNNNMLSLPSNSVSIPDPPTPNI